MWTSTITTFALLLAVPAAPRQHARDLPPGDYHPRIREEWKAEEARRASLPGGNYKDAFPDRAAVFDRHMERLADLRANYSREDLVYDATLADRLVAELYFDLGDPILNSAAQDFIIENIIAPLSDWPEARLSRTVRTQLLDGLSAFASAGGGRYTPAMQSRVAEALARLAAPDSEPPALVNTLLKDAIEWADEVDCEVQQQSVLQVCARYGPEDTWWRAFELERQRSPLPGDHPAGYDRAVRALKSLLDRPKSDEQLIDDLQRATNEAIGDWGSAAFQDDLTARLLITYRVLLARRPLISARAAQYIDNQLLRLVARAERLRTDEHWRLWARAVKELGRARMSERFRSYLTDVLIRKELSPQRRAIALSLAALVRSPASAPAEMTPAKKP